MARHPLLKNSLMAVLGLALGAGFLWLALRNVDVAELRATAATLDASLLLCSTLLYWVALSLRVLRWQLLLRELGPAPLPAAANPLAAPDLMNSDAATIGAAAKSAEGARRSARSSAQSGQPSTWRSIALTMGPPKDVSPAAAKPWRRSGQVG